MTEGPDVLDASALLALLQEEPGADLVEELLDGAIMSAVNLSEVIQKAEQHGGVLVGRLGVVARRPRVPRVGRGTGGDGDHGGRPVGGTRLGGPRDPLAETTTGVAMASILPEDGRTGGRRWSYLHRSQETPEVSGC